MKKNTLVPRRLLRSLQLSGVSLFAGLVLTTAQADQIQWGLTVTTINDPIVPTVVTNAPGNTNGPSGIEAPAGSITITGGGGDTYSKPDSFTYAYQQVTGDFDICVRIVNVNATDPAGQDSPKGALMVRASLDPASYDFQINALPLAPSGRNGQIENIGRLDQATDTDDVTGRGFNYGPGTGVIYPVSSQLEGDTTDYSYASYPDVWLRIQRQGEKMMSYFSTTNTEDAPAGFACNPGITNGWQLLGVIHAPTNIFPQTLYIGLNTCAHNSDITDTTHIVQATYASYGPTPTPASSPSDNGSPIIPGTGPGAFPNTKVMAANMDASISADGMGYGSDIVQSNQTAPQQIIWNSGGYGGVARDIIANISGETPGGFSFARYQAGSFDFMLNPQNPATALQNLGPYSNPLRERYTSGDTNVPASQAWIPSPNYGFVYPTVHKNGAIWNDSSTNFYAAAYVQLDGVATGEGYDMIGGQFRGGQFYTRTTKLVTGDLPNSASSGPSSGSLQRCAMPISIAWFPYDQGWKAGYFDSPLMDATGAGIAHWKRGDGWGLNSGTALNGFPAGVGGGGDQYQYNSPTNLLTWLLDSSSAYSGLAKLSLPGVNSVTNGMLFTVGNDENNSVRGPSASNAELPDGSGWYVALRDMETSKPDPTIYATGGGSDAGSSFSFLYMPYDAVNLVGGHIATDGSTVKGAGSFSITHLSTGRYALTIPGKTGTNGVLLLQNTGYLVNQPAGLTNVVDNSYLSYEYGGTNIPANAFIIQSVYVDDSGGGEGVVSLRDAEFNFVYVDFQNPVAPPGSITVPPVLSIANNSGNLTISWSNGVGYTLQTTSSLTPPIVWTPVGTANPSAPIPVAPGASYFRVVSQ